VASVGRRIGWVVLAAFIGLYGYWQGYRALRGMHANDFKHLSLGAIFLERGLDPYDEESFIRWAGTYGFRTINPYVYPPTTGLVLSFLTLWKPAVAAQVWFCLNHAMLVAALVLCAWFFVGFRDPWPLALVVALAATSFPLHRTLTAGQLNCALLLLYCGVYWASRRRREWLAGLLVGFGILFKLVPGVFVIYFLLKRRWKALGWAALWFIVILGVSVWCAGWKTHLAYWPAMRAMGYGKSVWQETLIAGGQEPFYRDPYNQSPNSFFHHVAAIDPLGRIAPWVSLEDEETGVKLANSLTVLSALCLVLLTLWSIGNSGSRPAENPPPGRPGREAFEVSLMILLSLLLPSILWDHYAAALFLVQIAVFGELSATRRWVSWQMGLLIAASVLLAWPIPFDHPQFRHGVGLLAMSAKMFGVLALYALALSELRSAVSKEPPIDADERR
jgi:hypothetical protein